MAATPSSIDPTRLLEEQIAQASPDLLRELLSTFINTLLSAEADTVCGADYGTTSQTRTNRRNGYRHRVPYTTLTDATRLRNWWVQSMPLRNLRISLLQAIASHG